MLRVDLTDVAAHLPAAVRSLALLMTLHQHVQDPESLRQHFLVAWLGELTPR